MEPINAQHLAEATWQAMNAPGGEEILDRIVDGHITVAEGIAALAVLSGHYERTEYPDMADDRE